MSTQPPDAGSDRFEQVYVESEFYDGVRSGLTDVNGSPHYFKAVDEHGLNEELDDLFYVWPTDPQTLKSEQRQWRVFVAWYRLVEAGRASESHGPRHPATRGIDAEYDQLSDELEPRRSPPAGSRIARATWRPLRRGSGRFSDEGPNYQVRWD